MDDEPIDDSPETAVDWQRIYDRCHNHLMDGLMPHVHPHRDPDGIVIDLVSLLASGAMETIIRTMISMLNLRHDPNDLGMLSAIGGSNGVLVQSIAYSMQIAESLLMARDGPSGYGALRNVFFFRRVDDGEHSEIFGEISPQDRCVLLSAHTINRGKLVRQAQAMRAFGLTPVRSISIVDATRGAAGEAMRDIGLQHDSILEIDDIIRAYDKWKYSPENN